MSQSYKVWIDRAGSLTNPHAITEVDGITYPIGTVLNYPDAIAYLGLKEIDVEDTPPLDYHTSPENYYRQEPTSAPYVVSYTLKSADQRKEIHNTKVRQEIDAVEKNTLFPRQLREFMLEQSGAHGKGWYRKIKDTDDLIMTLKAKLIP